MGDMKEELKGMAREMANALGARKNEVGFEVNYSRMLERTSFTNCKSFKGTSMEEALLACKDDMIEYRTMVVYELNRMDKGLREIDEAFSVYQYANAEKELKKG